MSLAAGDEGRVQRVTPYLARVLAPNPGPMTLEGTNTWVVGDPRSAAVLVVDPGPDVPSHLDLVLATCAGPVASAVLTHRHDDHAAGAPELARRAGCDIRAADPALRRGADGLADGSTIALGALSLRVVATPGHTSDSRSLLLRGDDGRAWLLTGDTVLGRGTTVIAAPDGDLGAYLVSLGTLQRLVEVEQVVELLPGHGPRVDAPAAWIAHYRRHREERLDQVRSALASGARGVEEIVTLVYTDIDPAVRPAAEQSVRAQLAYLEASA